MQTAVSIVALVLSAVSIGWQAATFVLTGGRVKVTLRAGAFRRGEPGMIHAEIKDARDVWSEHEQQQGYVRRVIVVQVHPAGRMPVTVEALSFVAVNEDERLPGSMGVHFRRPALLTLRPRPGVLIGPTLPHRLDSSGPSETWAVDLEAVQGFVADAKKDTQAQTVPVVAKVELGNGRVYTTGEFLRL